MLYRTLKRLMERGQTQGLGEKLDVFFAADKLTREEYEELTGLLGHWAGQLDRPEPVLPKELAQIFDWSKVPKEDIVVE